MVQRACLLAFLVACCTPAAASAGTWLPSGPPLSPAGADAAHVNVAMDAGGDVLAVWQRSDGSATRIERAFRPAGGTFSAPRPISDDGRTAWFADVAMDPQGNALAVWTRVDEGDDFRVQAAFRPAGGDFGPAQTLSDPGRSGASPHLAFDAQGNALVSWVENSTLRASFRAAGGGFAPPETISASGAIADQYDLSFDRHGNAMVVWSRGDATDALIEAAFRPAGGTFADAEQVAMSPDFTSAPKVAFDADGNAVVVYLIWDDAITDSQKYRVEAAFRPAGGDFEPGQLLRGGTPRDSASPDVAFDPQGTAVVVWAEGFREWAAFRPRGGAFAVEPYISGAGDSAYDAQVVIDRAGNAVAIWTATFHGAGGHQVAAAVRPPGGTFSDPAPISPVGVLQSSRDLALDAHGNAVAAWLRPDGPDKRVEVAGFDGAPPVIRAAFPRAGTADSPLRFSVDATDVWSPLTSSWAFGDGATAGGSLASHAYGSAGTYGARVDVTDALGNLSSAAATVIVSAAPVPIEPHVDRRAPDLRGLQLSPARFRAAARGGSIAASRTGTAIVFRLSEPAWVRFTVRRARSGRRVGGTCRAPTARTRRRTRRTRRTRCTSFVPVKGVVAKAAVAGENRLRFSGRLAGRKLAPARYRLIAHATDAAGNRSTPSRAEFRIVRR